MTIELGVAAGVRVREFKRSCRDAMKPTQSKTVYAAYHYNDSSELVQAGQHESHLAASKLAHVPYHHVISSARFRMPTLWALPRFSVLLRLTLAKCCEELCPPAFAGILTLARCHSEGTYAVHLQCLHFI